MRSRARLLAAGSTVFALGLVAGAATGVTSAAFSRTTSNSTNGFAARADWVAPTASAETIAKTTGSTSGRIKQGGTFYVYANVSDTGNPPSGVSTVTGNVNSVDTGQTTAALASGSFSICGTSYGYRTAALTANATLSAGTYSYSLTSSDAAGNNGTDTGFTVVVDNTAPTASDIQTSNVGGGTLGKPEAGDTVTFTFSETMDANSLVSAWCGASSTVTVRIADGGIGNDTHTVRNSANTAQLPLGSVNLSRTDYVLATRDFTSSTMVMSGSTIVITLGTASGATTTAAVTGAMVWTPSSSALDAAGNAMSTTTRTETGTADKDF